jgi:hypothetical protein
MTHHLQANEMVRKCKTATSQDDSTHANCIDPMTGTIRWQRQQPATQKRRDPEAKLLHPSNRVPPTPQLG